MVKPEVAELIISEPPGSRTQTQASFSKRSKSLQDCKKKLDFLHKAEKAHALDL